MHAAEPLLHARNFNERRLRIKALTSHCCHESAAQKSAGYSLKLNSRRPLNRPSPI